MRALVFGSLNIDYVYQVPYFVQRGETLASASFQRFCGGKGLNQAIALSRAGLETWMAGSVGPEGDFLLEELRRAGVDTGLVFRSETPTGHAIIQNSPDGDNCILLYGGANRAITPMMAREVLQNFDPGDLLLVQNEIIALAEIVTQGKERGMLVALNPSPMDAALVRKLLPSVDILILNRVEAEQLLGEKSEEPRQALAKLSRLSPSTLLTLTLGGDGALLLDRGECIAQPAFPVQPVDTTGAGDSFTGYLLAGLLQRMSRQDALRYAAAAAALAVTRHGAAPSIPTRDETLHFLAEG
ncbi:MAG: ribokinase [Oscillospiraceae bacterium]|nr:ribokinase [Oscillospiraceae bacterium]